MNWFLTLTTKIKTYPLAESLVKTTFHLWPSLIFQLIIENSRTNLSEAIYLLNSMQKPTTNTVDKTLKSVASAESLHIRINGLCMMPLIKDGAKVKIRNQRHYLPGDILVKRVANGQLVAHRLLGAYPRKGSLYYITRADNAQQEDGAVALGQIIGRVTHLSIPLTTIS